MSYLQNNSQKDGKTIDLTLIYSIQTANQNAFKVLAPPHLTLNLYAVQLNERQNRFADLK